MKSSDDAQHDDQSHEKNYNLIEQCMENDEGPLCHFFTAKFIGEKDRRVDDGLKLPGGPRKYITNPEQIKTFTNSKTYQSLLRYLARLNDSVKNLPCSTFKDNSKHSMNVEKIINVLEDLEKLTEENPPVSQPMRFGNHAFRSWLRAVAKCLELKLEKALEGLNVPKSYNIELITYLIESFGNYTRIDYGTGHEFNFLCFLYCLSEIKFFNKEDDSALVLMVFKRYISLVRHLQTLYVLEPAGSRGVWGLDDYNFLPFYFGSGQLRGQDSYISPTSSTDPNTIVMYKNEYLYLAAVANIMESKKNAPLGECAPLINDLTQVASWEKINSGLCCMYIDEVLTRFPVCQHFYFGKLIPWEPASSS